MTREETEYAITVMQAWLDGKTIEARLRPKYGEWVWLECFPDWRWDIQEYRIKPEPMEIEVWVSKNGKLALRAEDGHSYLQGGTDASWEKDGMRKKKFREVIE